jgi:hypothetical protein
MDRHGPKPYSNSSLLLDPPPLTHYLYALKKGLFGISQFSLLYCIIFTYSIYRYVHQGSIMDCTDEIFERTSKAKCRVCQGSIVNFFPFLVLTPLIYS